MWRMKRDSVTYYNLFHDVWGKIVLFYFYTYVTRQLIQLTLIIGKDAEETTKNISIIIVCFISAFKVSICTSEKCTTLINYIHKREKQIMAGINEENKRIYHYYTTYKDFVNIVFIVLAFSTTFLMCMRPVAETTNYYRTNLTIMYPERPLPFSVWYPFNKYKYYSIVYVEQVFDGFLACHYTACADTLFFSLIIFAIAQLRILRVTIKSFPQNVQSVLQNEFPENEDSSARQVLNCIVRNHQDVIKYQY